MNVITIGILAGVAAALAWLIMNLFADFLFLPVIRRHTDLLNVYLLARPGLNLIILAVDLVFWGAIFGAAYGLFYPGLERFGVIGGILWGVLMFISFSRGMIESVIWTKVPRDVNRFFFLEGLMGLAAWGLAFGLIFNRLIA